MVQNYHLIVVPLPALTKTTHPTLVTGATLPFVLGADHIYHI